MTAAEFLRTILDPGLAWCAAIPGWEIPADDRARVLMLAIAGQESNWTFRVQQGGGPAHGFWQFERGGGVAGVLLSKATKPSAILACEEADIGTTSVAAYNALPHNDNLATAFARLLLWSDPASLPALGQEDDCWEYYLRNWRPGKPGPDRWPHNYQVSLAAVRAPSP